MTLRARHKLPLAATLLSFVVLVLLAWLVWSSSLLMDYALWQGSRHLAAREYGSAVRYFDRARFFAPHRPEPLLGAGDAYREAGELDRAAEQYHVAMEVDPGNVGAMFGLGRITAATGSPATAAGYFRSVARDRPADPLVQSELANALGEQGDSEGARRALEVQLALAERDGGVAPNAHLRLALILAKDDRDAAAVHLQAWSARPAQDQLQSQVATTLRGALNLPEPRDGAGNAHFAALLGYGYLQLGWLNPARAQLELAVALAPDYGDALAYLGHVYARQGLLAGALDALRRSEQASPDSPLPHYFAGLALREQRRFDEAAAAFGRAVERAPSDAALRRELARAFVAAGDYPAAAETYENGLQGAPRDPPLLLEAASFYLDHLLRIDRGFELAKQSLDALPNDIAALEVWARALQLKGDRSGAITVLEKALAAHPTSAELEYRIAQLHEQLGERDAAIRYYQRAIDLDVGAVAERARKALDGLR